MIQIFDGGDGEDEDEDPGYRSHITISRDNDKPAIPTML
jgi:hypothetical protein